jgi:hypothetical protein
VQLDPVLGANSGFAMICIEIARRAALLTICCAGSGYGKPDKHQEGSALTQHCGSLPLDPLLVFLRRIKLRPLSTHSHAGIHAGLYPHKGREKRQISMGRAMLADSSPIDDDPGPVARFSRFSYVSSEGPLRRAVLPRFGGITDSDRARAACSIRRFGEEGV